MQFRKDFMRLMGKIAPYHHRYDVFRDFVTMAAISLHNAVHFDQELETLYLDTIRRYKPEDQKRFPELLGLLALGLEDPHDFLGQVFMEMDLGNAKTGQFFTPFEVSLMMAKMLVGSSRDAILDGRPFITVNEPASGAGGMVIAFAVALMERKVNPQQEMWVECIDIDPLAAMMTYLQLSLLHIPALVITGCAIAGTERRKMYTPSHVLGGWNWKLARFAQRTTSTPVVEPVMPAPTMPEAPPRTIVLPAVQLGLFEVA